ncbi:coenzyme A pyrophosphatase [Echinicola strongylocentroti]|uniref:Coenzyme A pyrophosphatase n=1 Tax=Echinicola strongylocentroti TaxID=1795355 RepID=A0A2Z4IP56_9BACT|nr:CoA pyrophosphatase [Echinicola strongylocentroti]AWW32911.1 coenzyme A pyrophosphatase [Echinicola strongylocentroti]
MTQEEVIDKLALRIKTPLPGKAGQIKMAPKPMDEARFAQEQIDNARIGAVLILLYPNGKDCMVPFIKRPDYDGTHGGQVSLPGGKKEPTDANLEETALRETEEEIGVPATKVKLLGKLSRLYIPPSNFLVTPFVGYVDELPLFTPDPREVARIIHCDFKTLVDNRIRKETTIKVRGDFMLQAPYFDIDKEVVWGATAMILAELMMIWEKKINDFN